MTLEQIEQVRCPVCHAHGGNLCVTVTLERGRYPLLTRQDFPHVGRLWAAEKVS